MNESLRTPGANRGVQAAGGAVGRGTHSQVTLHQNGVAPGRPLSHVPVITDHTLSRWAAGIWDTDVSFDLFRGLSCVSQFLWSPKKSDCLAAAGPCLCEPITGRSYGAVLLFGWSGVPALCGPTLPPSLAAATLLVLVGI